jgi:hypothetical protein
MKVCLLPCVIFCDCLALPSLSLQLSRPQPKESTARLKYDFDNMSDRDDQGLNEAVCSWTHWRRYIKRIASPRVPLACLGKPLLQRRPRLNGSVMLKRNAELLAEACSRFTIHGRGPSAFLTLSSEEQGSNRAVAPIKTAAIVLQSCRLSPYYESKCVVFRFLVKSHRIIFRFMVPSHHIAFRFMVQSQQVVFRFMTLETKACKTYL